MSWLCHFLKYKAGLKTIYKKIIKRQHKTMVNQNNNRTDGRSCF
uniref:Uncharacterized protein n=1 Tax=Rhizophora mucronata TaxID=61149 RepID=A0A2P2K3Q4_RHIMU